MASLLQLALLIVCSCLCVWIIASSWIEAQTDDTTPDPSTLSLRQQIAAIDGQLAFSEVVHQSSGWRKVGLIVAFPTAHAWIKQAEHQYREILVNIRRIMDRMPAADQIARAELDLLANEVETRWIILVAEQGRYSEWESVNREMAAKPKASAIAALYARRPAISNSLPMISADGWSRDKLVIRTSLATGDRNGARRAASVTMTRYKARVVRAAGSRLALYLVISLALFHLYRQGSPIRGLRTEASLRLLDARAGLLLFELSWLAYYVVDDVLLGQNVNDGLSLWWLPYLCAVLVTVVAMRLWVSEPIRVWKGLFHGLSCPAYILGAASLTIVVDAIGVEAIRRIAAQFDQTYEFTGVLYPYVPRIWHDTCARLGVGVAFDELWFRGFLLLGLAPLIGPRGAIVVAASIFGAFHPPTVWTAISAAWGGVVYGAAFRLSGSLWVCIIAHFFFNRVLS